MNFAVETMLIILLKVPYFIDCCFELKMLIFGYGINDRLWGKIRYQILMSGYEHNKKRTDVMGIVSREILSVELEVMMI